MAAVHPRSCRVLRRCAPCGIKEARIYGVLIDEAPIDGAPMYFETLLIDDEPMRWCPAADFEDETSSPCDYDHDSAIDRNSFFGSTGHRLRH